MINKDMVGLRPSQADREHELMGRRVQVFTTLSQMNKKEFLDFYIQYSSEVTMALTNYFVENWNEYWGLFRSFSDDDVEE